MSELDFTDEQNQILDSHAKNIIISACAGAGKSSTLLEKANRETKHCLAWKKIAILTFTNKSKNDLIEKIGNESISISTFHGFILENIFPFDSEIEDDLDQEFGKEANSYDDWLYHLYTHNKITGAKRKSDYVFQHALILCRKKNVINYLKSNFYAIYIDEAQDNNYQQYELVEIFIKCGIHILMVGDPNQTLYTFRGACAETFKKYMHDERFSKFEMKKNFRCHQVIDSIANSYNFPRENFKDENGGYFVVKIEMLDRIVDKLKDETMVFLHKKK